MGVPVTDAMKKARRLLEADPAQSRKDLANRLGFTRDALYKDPVCAAIIKQHRESKLTESK